MSVARAAALSRTLVLDGGMGSELRRRGVPLSAACWNAAANLSAQALVEQIHLDYVAAGADIITANTFASTRFVLAGAGLDAEFAALNGAAITAARAARDEAATGALVAASISCLPPRFDRGLYPSPEVEFRAYVELAEFCAERDVDLILLEMLQDPVHAALACRAVAGLGLPVCAGISCRLAGREPRHGEAAALVGFDEPSIAMEAVLDCVLAHDPQAIAIMHTPLEAMLPALARVGSVWNGPLAAYAEIPYREDPEALGAAPVTPATYADAARGWIDAGANIIGGCCGTGPAHIEALRQLLVP
jgi:S-methylmethionine-dependent homocysteine/selenocysteine methylase